MELKNDKTLVDEFDLYLQKIQGISDKARGNYLSWTRFLMKQHDLTLIHNEADVEKILDQQEMMRTSPLRKAYRNKRDITNFHSTLMRNFLPFICSYRKAQEAKRSQLTIDQMIDLVAVQDSQAHAETMGEAVMLLGYSRNYSFSDDQKQRLKGNLAKFGSMIAVDKLFLPGSQYNPLI